MNWRLLQNRCEENHKDSGSVPKRPRSAPDHRMAPLSTRGSFTPEQSRSFCPKIQILAIASGASIYPDGKVELRLIGGNLGAFGG